MVAVVAVIAPVLCYCVGAASVHDASVGFVSRALLSILLCSESSFLHVIAITVIESSFYLQTVYFYISRARMRFLRRPVGHQ